MIKLTIQNQLKDAMRARDAQRLETLRFVLSTLKYVEIEKHRELTDAEAIEVLSKEVKKRKDAIELFRNSGRNELVAEEEAKLKVITALLPEQMSQAEIEKIVDDVISQVGKDNLGTIMKALMPQTKGKADGKLVNEIVRKKME